MEKIMMVHQPTPWPAGPSCPQGGALCFSKVVGTDRDGSSVHTCPLGPGCQAMANFWLLVLLDHVHVRRAALPAPPAMEWTSHPLDRSLSALSSPGSSCTSRGLLPSHPGHMPPTHRALLSQSTSLGVYMDVQVCYFYLFL